MAVVQTGAVQTFLALGGANTGTVSTTITVPADAELVIAGWSGGWGVVNYFSTGSMTFTKGGVDTPMISASTLGDDSAAGAWQAAMFYLVLPDTGTNKTLKWDWLGTNSATDSSSLCSVTFWKGIDKTSPVRGSGGANVLSLPYTTGLITAQPGDLMIAWVAGSIDGVSGFEGTITSWSNLTSLNQITAVGINADGAWATGNPTANTTVEASTGTNFLDGAIVAAAFKPAQLTVGDVQLSNMTGPFVNTLAPIVIANNFNLAAPYTTGKIIGTVIANYIPTTWAITAGNALGYFAISNSGVITITAAGSSGITAGSNYSLTCAATNSYGTGSNTIPIAVAAGPVPVVTNTSFTLTLPVTNGQVVNTVTATNSPTSWSITAGNASGFFAISNSGVVTVTAAGASGITSAVYTLTVQATNASGSGSGTDTVTVNSGAVPVVTGGTRTVALPLTVGQNIGATVTATNSPTSWSITNNPGNCFSISNSGQITARTVDVPPQSYSLTVQATNAAGSGSNTITVTITTTGTIFYVATNGNDSNSGTSTGSPFLTVQRGINAANTAGSAVFMLAGTYSASTVAANSNGTAAGRIYISNYQQGNVIINFNGASGAMFQLNGSFVTVNGLVLDGSSAAGQAGGFYLFNANSSHMVGNTIRNMQGSGISIQGTSDSNYAIGNTVFNCCMNNVNNAFGSAGGWGDGINCAGTNNHLIGNTVHDIWGEGMGMLNSANNCSIEYNTIYNVFSVLLYVDGSTNATVRNNLCYMSTTAYNIGRTTDGIRFARESGAVNSGHKVYNNIVIGAAGGVSYLGYGQAGGINNSLIANNTLINNAINITADGANTGNILRNNISYGASSSPSGSASGFTCSNNCWFNATAGSFAGSGDITSNPLFVTAPVTFVATNYQVQSGSPCKLAGTNLFSSGVTVDFGDNARPGSGNFTIGAWQ